MNPNQIIALYVAAVGEKGAPSGEVYARMMADGISFETHQLVVCEFIRQDLMQEQFHYLTLTRKGLRILSRITEAVLVA